MRSLWGILLLSSCSWITAPFAGERCNASDPTRCEGEYVVRCVNGYEQLRSCLDGVCDPNLNDCLSARCGDGVIAPEGLDLDQDGQLDTAPEECDDGNNQSGDFCEADCTFPVCGNGILDTSEACDDGNLEDGDGCTHDCEVVFCASLPELPDLGAPLPIADCAPNCPIHDVTCGNDQLDPGEFCLSNAFEIFLTGHDANIPLLSDFNNDGLPDIAGVSFAENSLLISLQVSPRVFQETPALIAPLSADGEPQGHPLSIVAVDDNRDCDRDLIVGLDLVNAHANDPLKFFDNNGAGAFALSTTQTPLESREQPSSIATEDLNQDGIPDFVVASGDGREASVFFSNGAAYVSVLLSELTANPSGAPVLDFNVFSVLLEDLNGDGVFDLVAGDNVGEGSFASGRAKVFLGALDANHDWTVTLAPRQPDRGFFLSKAPQQLLLRDMNRDGLLDLIANHLETEDVAVLLGNGDGSFQDKRSTPLNAKTGTLTSADFNHDGYLDLALQVSTPQGIRFLFGDGSGGFYHQLDFPLDSVGGIQAADLDVDGSLDLVYFCKNAPDSVEAICVLFGNR